MHSNYVHFKTPQFRILSDSQLEEMHYATLQVLERTGVTVECEEAINLLADAGADISEPKRVKIPSHIVEQAISTAAKSFVLYTREGEAAITLDGTKKSHFGAISDYKDYLDPRSKQRRPCNVEDVVDIVRICDALPNMEWMYTIGAFPTLPGTLAEKLAFLHSVLNTSKPVACNVAKYQDLIEVLRVGAIVAGGENELQARPFVIGVSAVISPLVLNEDALRKSLFCAEKGIPNILACGPMAGATAPATFAGALVIANAEILGQLVISQLKKPGAPCIFGAVVTIMDMKTTIFSYGAPELSLIVAGLTEMSRFYKLPMFGTAGCTDAQIVGAQAGAEITTQVLLSALSGADFVHDVGIIHHSSMISPELIVLTDEVIEMVKTIMNGIEINDTTLPINLIDSVGPGGNYLTEDHTLKNFRNFWVPTVFDRSSDKGGKHCEELLNEKTINIMETHKPKQLPDDVVGELGKLEKTWYEEIGLKYEFAGWDGPR